MMMGWGSWEVRAREARTCSVSDPPQWSPFLRGPPLRRAPGPLWQTKRRLQSAADPHSTGRPAAGLTPTVVVWSLAERHELHDGIIHLQHRDGLPVHDGQSVPPARLVVRKASGEDNKRLAVVVGVVCVWEGGHENISALLSVQMRWRESSDNGSSEVNTNLLLQVLYSTFRMGLHDSFLPSFCIFPEKRQKRTNGYNTSHSWPSLLFPGVYFPHICEHQAPSLWG